MSKPTTPPSPTTPGGSADASGPGSGRTFLGHPPGLFLLFLVEMWERFSYYGMRALLVLYLTSPGSGMRKPPADAPAGFNPGPGWSDAEANSLYGWYTGLAYLTPVVGGIIADKFIGTHRSMLLGGLLIMLGHIALAVSGMGGLNNSDAGMSVFIGGLAAIVLGTGHFKPSVSVMVGQLYPPGDPRRDGAFSIFYMGINLGAFLCAFVCGTLGEKVGWHWGFGSAAVGMFLGLGLYALCKPVFLRGIGDAPRHDASSAALGHVPSQTPGRLADRWSGGFVALGLGLALLVGLLFRIGAFGAFQRAMSGFVTGQPTLAVALGLGLFAVAVAAATGFTLRQRPQDRGPVATIFIFMFFNAFFWLAFEQAGSSMTLFTDRYTDTRIGTWEMPTSWFQSVNPAIIFIFAPLFAALWTWLGKRKANPSQPVKISLGLILLGLGFVVLVAGARTISVAPGANDGPEVVNAKAAVWFLLGAYLFHTLGELCLSPTGLSYVTKAAPVKFVSLLMGIWFVSSFLANLGGGLIAAQTEKIEKGLITLPWSLGQGTGSVQADFFFLFVVTSVGAGLVILALSPWLRRMQRSPED
jgi:POT family proton-dependent oligopeptide transporter